MLSQREIILQELSVVPDQTSVELASKIGHLQSSVSSRLSKLVKSGRVTRVFNESNSKYIYAINRETTDSQ